MFWQDFGNWNSLWEDMTDLRDRLNRAMRTQRSYPGIRIYHSKVLYLTFGHKFSK